MIAHYNIIQGTDEWHEIRYAKVGGTRSAGLFIKSDNLLNEILAEKTEEFELDYDSFSSKAMEDGKEREPLARQALIDYLKINFKECGWIQSEENELLGFSPDGLSDCETIMIEIKCPANKKHLQTIRSNEIPLDNINQCIHAFVVNDKLQKLYFCSYRPESIKPMFVKELTRESLVNLGTKAKPDMKMVLEAVVLAKHAAKKLKEEVEREIEKLSF